MKCSDAVMRVGVLQVLCALGCSGGEVQGPGSIVRDSAGVLIVESSSPLWNEGAGWQITDEPLLRIGVEDGPDEYQMFLVGDVKRRQDGSILVANGSTAELRLYDAAGQHLWSVESVGRSRGEARVIPLHVRAGDSIGVLNPSTAQYFLHDPDGRLVRTLQLPLPAAWTPFYWAEPLGNGALLAQLFWHDPRVENGEIEPRRQRVWHTFVSYDLQREGVDTLGAFLGSEYLVTLSPNSGIRSWGHAPFAWSRVQDVRGEDLLVAYTERFEVLVHDSSLRLKEIYRLGLEPRPVIEAERDSVMTQLREAVLEAPVGATQERRRQTLEVMSFPPTHPVIDQLTTDALGHTWLRHADVAGVEGRAAWSVLDPNGTWLGDVTMPRKMRVTHIGSDYVLGVLQDELNVEYVVMYGLTKQ
jgi:hypothetical protein